MANLPEIHLESVATIQFLEMTVMVFIIVNIYTKTSDTAADKNYFLKQQTKEKVVLLIFRQT